jgi:hypothetical protein
MDPKPSTPSKPSKSFEPFNPFEPFEPSKPLPLLSPDGEVYVYGAGLRGPRGLSSRDSLA